MWMEYVQEKEITDLKLLLKISTNLVFDADHNTLWGRFFLLKSATSLVDGPLQLMLARAFSSNRTVSRTLLSS